MRTSGCQFHCSCWRFLASMGEKERTLERHAFWSGIHLLRVSMCAAFHVTRHKTQQASEQARTKIKTPGIYHTWVNKIGSCACCACNYRESVTQDDTPPPIDRLLIIYFSKKLSTLSLRHHFRHLTPRVGVINPSKSVRGGRGILRHLWCHVTAHPPLYLASPCLWALPVGSARGLCLWALPVGSADTVFADMKWSLHVCFVGLLRPRGDYAPSRV
ncbi:unnamed protein product [Pylaiella littoralis]